MSLDEPVRRYFEHTLGDGAAPGADTGRSAAGRAALEAIWSPAALLPERGAYGRRASSMADA